MEAVESMKGSVSGCNRVGDGSFGRRIGSKGMTMTGTTICHGREDLEDDVADDDARSGRETAQMAMHSPPQRCNYGANEVDGQQRLCLL